MPASYETHRKQLELILQAWGMPAPTAASTAEIMSWADLHGIDNTLSSFSSRSLQL